MSGRELWEAERNRDRILVLKAEIAALEDEIKLNAFSKGLTWLRRKQEDLIRLRKQLADKERELRNILPVHLLAEYGLA